MLIYLKTIVLSIVQAMTEFLPVSSSGHLIIFHNLIDSGILNSISFDVALHGGTAFAIIIYFWKDIIIVFKNFKSNLKNKTVNNDLLLLIIIAVIPAVLVGYFFEDIINNLRSVIIVAIVLVFGSILFILAEKFFTHRKNLSNISVLDSVIIGITQCLAFIPGISRSGITIIAGMNRGLSRTDSAKFSFLLAIPLLLGALIKKTADVVTSAIEVEIFVFAFFTTFVFGLLAVKILMRLLRSRFGLYGFAIYRIILAIIIFIFFLSSLS